VCPDSSSVLVSAGRCLGGAASGILATLAPKEMRGGSYTGRESTLQTDTAKAWITEYKLCNPRTAPLK